MEVNENQTQIKAKADNWTMVYFAIAFIVVIFSNFGYVKSNLSDSIATIVLFLIITVFVCAGIGWWQKRQEK